MGPRPKILALVACFAAGIAAAGLLAVTGAAETTTAETTTAQATTAVTTTVPAETTQETTTVTIATTTTVESATTQETAPTTAPAEESSDEGTAAWVWVLLAILAVALAVAIVLLARRGGRGSLSAEERGRRLDHAVGTWAAQGWAVEAQTLDSAVLHRAGERMIVAVDASGQITTRPG